MNLTFRSEHHLSSVYLADGGGALLVVKVWNGLKVRREAEARRSGREKRRGGTWDRLKMVVCVIFWVAP